MMNAKEPESGGRHTISKQQAAHQPLLLAVETSGVSGSVALVHQEKCIAELSLQTETTHSRKLLDGIDFLMRQSEYSWEDIDGIAISLGPGSFTGLRIGLSTVKGLAMAAGKPILGVPSLDGLATQFPFEPRLICPVIDARKKQVYAAFYRIEGERILRQSEYLVLSPESLAERIDEPTIFVGDGALLYLSLFQKILADHVLLAPAETHFPRAAAIGKIALEKWKADDFLPPESAVPLYIRASDAELGFGKPKK